MFLLFFFFFTFISSFIIVVKQKIDREEGEQDGQDHALQDQDPVPGQGPNPASPGQDPAKELVIPP